MKQNGFFPPLPRLFTRQDCNAYDLIHFREREESGDDFFPALTCPDGWGNEAASVFASEAAYAHVPLHCKAIEENTVPSWLWRHENKDGKTQPESRAQQILDRVVGAAVYRAWKDGLFLDEVEARNFFDETRYALATRCIAFDPAFFAQQGIDWAYGCSPTTASTPIAQTKQVIAITNDTIDAIVRGSADKTLRGSWQHAVHAHPQTPTTLRFANTISDWEPTVPDAVPVMLDLLAFRHNDGSINIDALCHAVRLAVTLADLLNDTPNIAIGFSNLAPLFMAFALPYDSDAARMTAAGLSAIVTAEAYITSAQLAALRGMAPHFTADRDVTLRALRNHRRAAYGDTNDYEKIAVLPQPLTIVAGLDLPLVAAAQRLWDQALELARLNGLRHTQVTALTSSAALTLFTESLTQSIDAVPSLAVARDELDDTFIETPLACLTEGLTRLGYTNAHIRSIVAHATGHRNLVKAPVINHAALRMRGFDAEALARIENYVQRVNTIRLAFTPWIVGHDFCLKTLKIPAKKLDSMSFDLLRYLGFNDADVTATNTYCYGHGSVKGAKDLQSEHVGIFVRRTDVTPEAMLRMASAVQAFVSGDVMVEITLPKNAKTEKGEALALSAWRQGLKTLSLSYYDTYATAIEESDASAKAARKAGSGKRTASMLHTQKPNLPSRKTKSKAGMQLLGLGSSRGKNASVTRSKTR